MNENNEVTLFNGNESAVGFTSRVMASGANKVSIETRSVWAKANGLKPSCAEARKGYAAHMRAQSAKLAAGVSFTVAENGYLPKAVTKSRDGDRLTVVYEKPGVIKEVVSVKKAELMNENAKLRKLLAAAGMDANAVMAGLNGQIAAASKVA